LVSTLLRADARDVEALPSMWGVEEGKKEDITEPL
jgi:hypothetical protein